MRKLNEILKLASADFVQAVFERQIKQGTPSSIIRSWNWSRLSRCCNPDALTATGGASRFNGFETYSSLRRRQAGSACCRHRLLKPKAESP